MGDLVIEQLDFLVWPHRAELRQDMTCMNERPPEVQRFIIDTNPLNELDQGKNKWS
jgi:hypothetical protein